MKIYFAHGWNEIETISCLDGNNISSDHVKYVKNADILIFKLNYEQPSDGRKHRNEGEISKGILNEIQAAQEAGIPIYLWRNGKLTDDPAVLAALPLRKWKRNFKNTEHPFK